MIRHSKTAAAIAAMLAVGAVVIGFQNCARNLPPEASKYESSSQSALQLVVPSANVPVSGSLQLSAKGGTPPYVFMIVSGGATIGADTGLLQAGAAAGNISVQVSDGVGSISQALIVIGGTSTGGIIPGSAKYESPGTYMFTVPPFRLLKFQLKGAGGGGGGANLDTKAGTSGAAGGASSVLTVKASGGAGGAGSNYYGGVNYTPTAKGASGAGSGGDTNAAGGGAPGGAGGSYGLTYGQGGGDGGSAIKTFDVSVTGSPAIGSTVTLTIGAGGKGGATGGSAAVPSGTNGAIFVNWDP